MNPSSKKTVPIMGALLLAGVAIGASATYGLTTTNPPAPRTVTETQTVTNDVVPATCVQALDAADDLLDLHTQVITVTADTLAYTVPDIIDAVSVLDVAGIDAGTANIQDATAQVQDLTNQASEINYAGPSIACRTAAGE